MFPGQQGGPNFGGVAVDQTLGYVFVNSRDVGGMGRLDKTPDGDRWPIGGSARSAAAR